MGDSTKFHPALSITNVKALVPITLDLHSSEYHSWAALFKVQARVHDVLDHIIPPVDTTEKAAAEKTKSENPTLWKRLDAVVLQWMYSTVSTDILTSILIDDDSAEKAWNRIADMFHDNKSSRALFLNKEFTNTMLSDFASTNAYCTRLKSLADQLQNVGAPVNDHALVLKMLQGLTDSYANFVTVMQNKRNLPSFTAARSKLALEETTIAERMKLESSTVALAATDDSSSLHSASSGGGNGRSQTGGGQPNLGQNGGGQSGRGGNRGTHYGGGGQQGQQGGGGQQRPFAGQPWQPPPWWYMSPQQGQWSAPPCPYPSQQWAQPWTRQSGPPLGVLGPRPGGQALPNGPQQQAYAAQQWAPTDIEAAMNTMSLSPPDPNWYMDTGATSHMTAAQDGELPPEV